MRGTQTESRHARMVFWFAFGMLVKSDYERSFNFRHLQNFQFKLEHAMDDSLYTNTLDSVRLQIALKAQLEGSGFSQSSQTPDLIVAFYSRARKKSEIQDTSLGGFGFGRDFGWGYTIPSRSCWRFGFGAVHLDG